MKSLYSGRYALIIIDECVLVDHKLKGTVDSLIKINQEQATEESKMKIKKKLKNPHNKQKCNNWTGKRHKRNFK